jgi:hypothetical protein
MTQEINLLPPILQRKRTRRLYLARLMRLMHLVDLLLGMIIIAQVGALVVYNTILKDVTAGTAEGTLLARDVRREVNGLNELLTAFNERVDGYVGWTDQLEDTLALFSEPVLVGMTADEAAGSWQINGTSSSRSAVVALREKLEQLPWVTGVEVPLENFTVGTDAGFTLIVERK